MADFSNALDHRETVLALEQAMPDRTAQLLGGVLMKGTTDHMASALARHGLALVRVEEVGSTPLQQEAANHWFGTEGEQA
jgi:hypothetical protein